MPKEKDLSHQELNHRYLQIRQDDLWKYIATYVDDLLIVSQQPLEILKVLQNEPYNFKLKGSGPINFHLGCGFTRDKHNILCMDPKKYIEKMVQSYEQMFDTKLGKDLIHLLRKETIQS